MPFTFTFCIANEFANTDFRFPLLANFLEMGNLFIVHYSQACINCTNIGENVNTQQKILMDWNVRRDIIELQKNKLKSLIQLLGTPCYKINFRIWYFKALIFLMWIYLCKRMHWMVTISLACIAQCYAFEMTVLSVFVQCVYWLIQGVK